MGVNHRIEVEQKNCKCDIVVRMWNLDPERYEFRQNWLSQNVPAVFKAIGKKEDKDGMVVDILECKDCGRRIEVSLMP